MILIYGTIFTFFLIILIYKILFATMKHLFSYHRSKSARLKKNCSDKNFWFRSKSHDSLACFASIPFVYWHRSFSTISPGLYGFFVPPSHLPWQTASEGTQNFWKPKGIHAISQQKNAMPKRSFAFPLKTTVIIKRIWL